MDIEIIAVGGYDEVGRNMTAVRCGKEIVIFDMGLRLDQVMIHEEAEVENLHSLDLIQMKAIPDDTMMNTVEHQKANIRIRTGSDYCKNSLTNK